MKNYCLEVFCDVLGKVEWSSVLGCRDVDKAWVRFKELFSKVLDRVAPYKRVRIKQRSEPWINDDILRRIKLRNYCFKKFKNDLEASSFELYKLRRNMVRDMIREAKMNYFKNKVNENRHEPKIFGVC